MPEAYCESMCVFLLLSGKTRYVPETAHVGCIRSGWAIAPTMQGLRAIPREDLMIVERDIGRLAKYTFDMGGAGDLLALSLSVPPWEDLHELSPEELRLTNLVTTDAVAEVLPRSVRARPWPNDCTSRCRIVFASSVVHDASTARRPNRPRPPRLSPDGGVVAAGPAQ